MRVFIMGGTGSIGSAVLKELIARSHAVLALSRSASSDEKIVSLGATPLRGDLREPSEWARLAVSHDAIVQVAATFSDDMGDVDAGVISALIEAAADVETTPRLLYTGGCWLYGETGDAVAAEDRPFDPPPAFAWMVEQTLRLLGQPAFSTAIIHPAMVYEGDGGVFERFLSAAREGRPIEIWGGAETRWPLIHHADLARAYCDLLVRPELAGHFNAVAEEGVRVGDIVGSIAARHGARSAPVVVSAAELIETYGEWAKGP
ncbi:MAG: NAD-dependent epimerase/dehydratase family protein, partial [Pseudomonadota bacterium]